MRFHQWQALTGSPRSRGAVTSESNPSVRDSLQTDQQLAVPHQRYWTLSHTERAWQIAALLQYLLPRAVEHHACYAVVLVSLTTMRMHAGSDPSGRTHASVLDACRTRRSSWQVGTSRSPIDVANVRRLRVRVVDAVMPSALVLVGVPGQMSSRGWSSTRRSASTATVQSTGAQIAPSPSRRALRCGSRQGRCRPGVSRSMAVPGTQLRSTSAQLTSSSERSVAEVARAREAGPHDDHSHERWKRGVGAARRLRICPPHLVAHDTRRRALRRCIQDGQEGDL